MAHTHEAHDIDVPVSTKRLLAIAMAPLLLAIGVGLLVLWPGQITTDRFTQSVAADEIFDAKVTAVETLPCEGTDPDVEIACTLAEVRLLEGPDEGQVIELEEPVEGGIDLDAGDRIVLAYYADAPSGFEYSFSDRERQVSLVVLAALFAVAVVALGRWKGARALVGVAMSLTLLTAFILPALLEGSEPVVVALVGAGAIAVVALYLSHGVNVGSTIALIGAFASLALVGLLAWIFVAFTELTGNTTEEALFLQVSGADVQLRGLILAGIVIGTLGVLDDVTVLQVSSVWELHSANPELPMRSVFGAALRIGRDHIASTVNTLVLAYAGASLPLFLLLTQAQQGLADTANSEVIAVEIVRALVGSIGLVASVPVTTALAVWVIGQHKHGGSRHDPRRYRSRTERWLWGE